MRTRTPEARPSSVKWRRAATALVMAAASLYLAGLAFLIPWENDYHSCNQWRYDTSDVPASQGPDFVDMDRRALLPQATCRWADGSTVTRVPRSLNLGVLLTLAASAGAATAARRTGRTGRGR
ncbi:hypothetical protein [Actinomadura sp. 3N407]|uniref:hypothetical protein n=1 Tax=Actinomadura sp. 3N407 TaxID=3457423 RepID=UPI003FCC89DB